MWKTFSKIFQKQEKREAKEISDFLFALEKLSNLAAAKAQRNENVMANDIVGWLEQWFRKFFAIKEKDERRYRALLEQGDLYENKAKLVVPGVELAGDDGGALLRSIYKNDASYANVQNQRREQKMVDRFLNAFGKIWAAAVKAENEEISASAAYALERILANLAAGKDNKPQIQQILRYLNFITYELIVNNTAKKMDRSIYPLSVNTYINIVFNHIGRDFDLDYLPDFDGYFLRSIRMLIEEGQRDIFSEFIHLAVDGTLVPSHTDARLWDYKLDANLTGPDGEALHRDIQKLERDIRDVNTRTKLNDVIARVKTIEERLSAHLALEHREKFQKTKNDLCEFAVDRYKYNNFLELVFDIGAYCLFKDRAEYIRYLWEYKQPPDSDAVWIGEDIIPRTIPEVIAPYFRMAFPEREHDWWEGHHGKGPYYKRYFLLLIARTFKLNPRIEALPQIREAMARLNAYQLSDLEYFSRDLAALAADLAKEKKFLMRLGFQKGELNELFGVRLPAFLEQLSPEAQRRIEKLKAEQRISQAKVAAFKDQVLKGFENTVVMRKIFESAGLFEDKIADAVPDEIKRLGMNHMEDKGAFFDEWHVSYGEIGVEYGQHLAAGEDLGCFGEIVGHCEKIDGHADIETLLNGIDPANALIVGQNVSFSILFQKKKSYRPQWRVTAVEDLPNGFQGRYLLGGKEISIFDHHVGGYERRVLVLDKSRLGKFVQYSPLDPGESDDLKKGVFYMNVVAPSEDEATMNDFLTRAPEWLKNMGDAAKQREYLAGQVVIKLFERFVFQPAGDFVGRVVEIGDEFAAQEWI